MSEKIRCVVCDTKMDNIMGDKGYQPNDGVAFYSYGHYGSTVFDPMDGTYIQVTVCDKCMSRAFERGIVRDSAPTGKGANDGTA